jgi:hypothetical protein
MLLSELVETCRSHDFTDVVVLHEHRGEPGGCGGSPKAPAPGDALRIAIARQALCVLGFVFAVALRAPGAPYPHRCRR